MQRDGSCNVRAFDDSTDSCTLKLHRHAAHSKIIIACLHAAFRASTVPVLPMFGGDKVVWLRNANLLADTITGRAQRTEEGVARLQQVLESGLPDGVRFLLSASAVDKRRSFWKWLEKHAQVVLCDRIDTSRDGWQDQIAAIVIRRANELCLEFDSDALALFVMLAGEQSQQIAN